MEVFITVAISLLLIVLGLLLAYSIKLEFKRLKEEKYINNLNSVFITKSKFLNKVKGLIKKRNSESFFTLAKIVIKDITEIESSLDDIKYNVFIKQLSKLVATNISSDSCACFNEDFSILILITNLNDRNTIINNIKNIMKGLKKPFSVEDIEIVISSNIAVSFFPNHGVTLEDLFKNLDLTIYLNKEEVNTVKVFSKDVDNMELVNFNYYHEIKEGIKNNKFFLMYQPIYNIETNKIYSFESLIRWDHIEKGIVYPFEFINAMERSGDINWLGSWVFEETIKTFFNIKKIDQYNEIKMNINISGVQLIESKIVTEFKRLVNKYRINANNFILEINNFNDYIEHENVIANIALLKNAGFLISIEAGELDYLNVSNMNSLNFDILKLNKDYIENKDNPLFMNISNIIVDYCREKNKLIIQEYVETQEDLEYLKTRDIKLAQGFYFEKPVLFEEIERIIKK